MAVQIAVIDDWQDGARDVVDWSVLDSLGEVTFEHDYPADNATLAERLGLTHESARTYLKRVYRKLGLAGQRELFALLMAPQA